MPYPFLVGVIETMRQPLALQQCVALLAEKQRLPALELAVLLAKGIQVDGAPETGSFAPNDNYEGAVDSQEDGRACPAVDGMLDSFVNALSLAAVLPQTDDRPANKAQAGLFGNRIAVRARFVMIKLEKCVERVGKSEESRAPPRLVLEEKSAGDEGTAVEEDSEFAAPDADDGGRLELGVELGLAADVQVGAQLEELLIVRVADAVARQRVAEEVQLQQRRHAQKVQRHFVERLLDVRLHVHRLPALLLFVLNINRY